MTLPHAHLALVEREKNAGYLLNPAHPDNGGKAAFFFSLGFRVDDWPVLAAAFLELAMTSPVGRNVDSPHGHKYILDGRIRTPSGKTPVVRTIWIVDLGREGPRLVTAYPKPE